MRPIFTLTVATSSDGYIARATDDAPQSWASEEEQVLFFRDVNEADWAIMGRHTHLAAEKPERRRIIFSSSISGWQRETQLWLDPAKVEPSDLANLVAHRHPLNNGLILGGTRVHDWFLAHGAIDRVNLTVEPIAFGAGLPVFSDQMEVDPMRVFLARGFDIAKERVLNAQGTRYLEMTRAKGVRN